MLELANKECPFCHSKWQSRVAEPVRCPRCKRVIVKVETGANLPGPTPATSSQGVAQ